MPEEREDLLRETGKKIQRKREALGYSLDDVHEGTKIRINFLEGIENGDYSGFPGTVYVRGFIRTYLQFLDAEDLWSEFLPILSEGIERRRTDDLVMGSCTPPAKGFKPASRLWLFVLLMMIVTGSGWYVWYSWEQSGVSLFEQNGDRALTEDEKRNETDPLEEEKLPPAIGAEEKTSSEDPGDAHEGVLLSQDEEGKSSIGFTTAAELVSGPDATTPTPAPAPEKKEDGMLIITADGECWVRVREGGKTIYEKTMRPGETIEFKVTQRNNVTYGRAGAVRVTWNGKDIGRPGNGVERVYYAPDGSTGKGD